MKRFEIHRVTDEEDAIIQAGIDADPDAFEITEEMMKDPRFTVVDKRHTKGPPRFLKIQKTVRLSPAVLDYLRDHEKGWQTRLDKALEIVMKEYPEGID